MPCGERSLTAPSSALVAATLVLLAGCVSPAETGQAPVVENQTATDGTGIGDPDAGDAGETEPTLAAPPRLRVGDWWRIKLSDVFGGNYEVTRVVAAETDTHYLVGSPEKEFSDDLLVLHLPGFGEVAKDTLAFDMHYAPFQPAKFPLLPGDTWKTAFEARPVEAEVVSVGGTRAEVEFVGANDRFTLHYYATTREVVKFVHEGYATFEVIAGGTGFEGPVVVPYEQDLIFQHGRFAGVLNIGGRPPQPPIETISVKAGYDRASFVIILATLQPGPLTTGLFMERVTAPDGKVFESTLAPPEPGGFKITTYAHDKPGGDWQLQHVAAGAGFAAAEGIAYKVLQVTLPPA